jgi:hypothetical protein
MSVRAQCPPIAPETLAENGFVFGREEEMAVLRRRLAARKSFVLHGPSGSGKTFLLQQVIRDLPEVLYCPQAASPQLVVQSLALGLVELRDRYTKSFLRNAQAVKLKSTISLRGIVLEAVRRGRYFVVLDHLQCPAAALSSDTRNMMFYGETPIVAVARSAHMEDLGFLTPMFALRAERMRLSNFSQREATQFAEVSAHRIDLWATNLPEFLARAVDLSQGSPGAILRMLRMAKLPQYRLNGYIKTTPIYIDFRLAWHAENAW